VRKILFVILWDAARFFHAGPTVPLSFSMGLAHYKKLRLTYGSEANKVFQQWPQPYFFRWGSRDVGNRSLVPKPIRAMRVSGGGLEPSAIARVQGEFSRRDLWVTSHLIPRRGRLGTRLGHRSICRKQQRGPHGTQLASFRKVIYKKNTFKVKNGESANDPAMEASLRCQIEFISELTCN